MRQLPKQLEGLVTLALDLRRSSSALAHEVWSRLDPDLWSSTRNPWLMLETVPLERFEQLAKDHAFLDLIAQRLQLREHDLTTPHWFKSAHEDSPLKTIAYFSMEFGLSEALPIYSGGLGLLAGDHLKAASDLGVPLVGVGLLYGQGYFRQAVGNEGNQIEYYPYNEPAMLPITRLRDEEGKGLLFHLNFCDRTIHLRVWEVMVGLIKLYLLDSNHLLNGPADRGLTSELYGGGPRRRLQQEIILGIGGWRLLGELGIKPDVCHLNEGHAAFAALERARETMKQLGCSFAEALSITRAGNLFTTHTPVTAGFDRFERAWVEEYLGTYADDLGIGVDGLMGLGRANPEDQNEPLNMAYLAVRCSGGVNGVSKLHGVVSRQLFASIFPRWPLDEVPVGSVTNGVHIPSWESPDANSFWTDSCGHDRWFGTLESVTANLRAVPDDRLLAFRCLARKRLIEYLRKRTGQPDLLSETALTIGFARRFATYKRPTLLLHDEERLVRLLNHPERPIQLLIAGKAHPADEPGKAMIKRWQQFVQRSDVRGKVIFIPDYDILLAERLVQGVDLWLNTPRRPFEASGTSGMKVLVNGGLNLSELDGWWAEAYSPQVGWALGDFKEHGEDPNWDAQEANTLYALLEQEIVPLFYGRESGGVPSQWLERVRESMARLTPYFSTNRMVREYVDSYYLPLARNYFHRLADGGKVGKGIAEWTAHVSSNFRKAKFGELQIEASGTSTLVQVAVELGELDPTAVAVQLFGEGFCLPMTRGRAIPGGFIYSALLPGQRNVAEFTPRLVPSRLDAQVPLDCPHILWQR